MTKLAASSGTIIYEGQNKLYIAKMPAQWTATFLFVTGVLAFILFSNGVLMLFVFKPQPAIPQSLGIILTALGVLFAFISWKVNAYRKKMNSKPVNELECICIIDLAAGTLLDGKQQMLAPLDQVKLNRRMQITSSSPKLVLQWHNNSLTVVEGNPFSGGIADVEKVLISKGLIRK